MQITGIICEYNPFHLGHKRQLDTVKAAFPEGGTVCFMSGYYVQRGAPAIVDPAVRAQAALHSGADLVLEMPVTGSLSSAEGFARTGVRILGGFCDRLCFGAETGTAETLTETAEYLLSPAFSAHLRTYLDTGASFPKARQLALQAMGADASLLENPNDTLGVEYCKAILTEKTAMQPYPIRRTGDYRAETPCKEAPSATAVRRLMLSGEDWTPYVPEACPQDALLHALSFGERAILYRLRTMTEEEFAALPYGSEGLWRKLMHSAHRENTLEEILTGTKSKRYTRTRLDRMVMCAVLGIDRELLEAPAPYVRVLALNGKGREILKKARQTGTFLNLGEPAPESPYSRLEKRAADLYGLFAQTPEAPELRRHMMIQK